MVQHKERDLCWPHHHFPLTKQCTY
jgi:hypothetical protein